MYKPIKDLKEEEVVRHQTHGVLQYIGLTTINPFSNIPVEPKRYGFWTEIDEEGKYKEIVLIDGNELVEII